MTKKEFNERFKYVKDKETLRGIRINQLAGPGMSKIGKIATIGTMGAVGLAGTLLGAKAYSNLKKKGLIGKRKRVVGKSKIVK